MKIITSYFKVYANCKLMTQEDGVQMLRWIEFNGRLSHRSEDAMTDESYKRFIPAVVIDKGDWSITEHASATVVFRVNRGVTHELVRHRLFSFTQESTRFVNYTKKIEMEFIMPEVVRDPLNYTAMEDQFQAVEKLYSELISKGIRPQEARAVLPNALAATISVTGNLRNWRHFFLMRTSKETHPDFKQVSIPLLEVFKQHIPYLYDDIEPNARQIDNLQKGR